MSDCPECGVAAGGAVLISGYCKLPDNGCEKLRKKFQEGNMTLRELGEKVNAPQEFMQFLNKEAPIDVTIGQLLNKNKKESEV